METTGSRIGLDCRGRSMGIMAAKGVTILGRGLYRLPDVARYTQLHAARLRSWFIQRTDLRIGPVFTSDYEDAARGARVVSFLDMVDAWMAGQLRAEGVSMRTIRAAHAALTRELKTDHPFAHKSIYTDGKRIFGDAAAYVNDPTLTDVISRQTFFPRVRQYLTLIEYSSRSQLAERWNIADGVVIDPAISFGQPVVKGTGVTTFVVFRSYRANESDAALVGELFGITQTDVGCAVDFEERYGHQRAA